LPLAFQRSSTSSSSSVDPPSSYTELVDKLRTIAQLRQASAVLDYDRMTVMPQAKDTSDLRGAQLSALAAVIHEKATDNSIPLLIDKSLQESNNLCTDQIQLLKLTKRSFEKNYKISAELEKRRTELASLAYSAWVQARKDSDFPSFVPILTDGFDTAMEVAKAHRGVEINHSDHSKNTSLYTEMLDEYEMGMSAERIDDIFSEIETALVPLIQKVLESKSQPKTDALRGTFPIEIKKKSIETL
jgi:carboxypeptidase Taq